MTPLGLRGIHRNAEGDIVILGNRLGVVHGYNELPHLRFGGKLVVGMGMLARVK
jgi:hypothetical protein